MILKLEERSKVGSNAAQALRASGHVPAVLYGPKQAAQAVSVPTDALAQLMRTEKPTLHPFHVSVGSKKHQVLLKSYVKDLQSKLVHVDFYVLAKGAKVTVVVPVKYENEESAVGIKAGGVVTHHITELKVDALPKDIPDHIVVDIANLDIGDIIHLSALKVPGKVELHDKVDEQHDPILVSCKPPTIEEESVEVEAEQDDVPMSEGDESEEQQSEQKTDKS
ncbi:50S ribosomal protein L25 [Candidatus Comchoanobacter bicostacola]|uniref:Large ribosomal subunit protein bL25 n=1 Tax=Candidatus Comchoanobacter bicostacola TaxID=2919598 RepID=A0ABY5DLB6_9GAMM|nr:50S ribosomal protein L25 [Candidatus Comchoanobacter bicostacola]UTC24567.1 50S ribosomal protein L25 [Candidatus Comchoanobacter bicostacola]